jgi:hypothetical protein
LEEGYEVVTLVSSCSLMFKQEWPNFLPDDPLVKKLSQSTSDISEYIVKIAKKEVLKKTQIDVTFVGINRRIAERFRTSFITSCMSCASSKYGIQGRMKVDLFLIVKG